MRTHILAIALALSTSSAFAVNTCDTMPTKNQRDNCWSTLIGNYQAEADEYAFAVQESKKVPASAKRKVEVKRRAIEADATRLCRKDSLGYPENSCYIEQFEKFKDFTYKETSKYGMPDMRLN
ncbi:hypothetical protein HF908_02750 [Ralstonia pseudosolanacearum]|uniref:hypothetical protein n=1 Tax=Ralstonia pseudosolanacearum TaxID=1310165 RepID=UPI001867F18D|nr:hypothetical protein [Ralstonia pseudosolanacearum]QOK90507.1 hypothetical protein HF908_02750 [Ralstonia pseudosolanacearum]